MMINYDIVSCVDTHFLVLCFGPPIGYESSQAKLHFAIVFLTFDFLDQLCYIVYRLALKLAPWNSYQLFEDCAYALLI